MRCSCRCATIFLATFFGVAFSGCVSAIEFETFTSAPLVVQKNEPVAVFAALSDPDAEGEIIVSDGEATCTIELPAKSCQLVPTSTGDVTLYARYVGPSPTQSAYAVPITQRVRNHAWPRVISRQAQGEELSSAPPQRGYPVFSRNGRFSFLGMQVVDGKTGISRLLPSATEPSGPERVVEVSDDGRFALLIDGSSWPRTWRRFDLLTSRSSEPTTFVDVVVMDPLSATVLFVDQGLTVWRDDFGSRSRVPLQWPAESNQRLDRAWLRGEGRYFFMRIRTLGNYELELSRISTVTGAIDRFGTTFMDASAMSPSADGSRVYFGKTTSVEAIPHLVVHDFDTRRSTTLVHEIEFDTLVLAAEEESVTLTSLLPCFPGCGFQHWQVDLQPLSTNELFPLLSDYHRVADTQFGPLSIDGWRLGASNSENRLYRFNERGHEVLLRDTSYGSRLRFSDLEATSMDGRFHILRSSEQRREDAQQVLDVDYYVVDERQSKSTLLDDSFTDDLGFSLVGTSPQILRLDVSDNGPDRILVSDIFGRNQNELLVGIADERISHIAPSASGKRIAFVSSEDGGVASRLMLLAGSTRRQIANLENHAVSATRLSANGEVLVFVATNQVTFESSLYRLEIEHDSLDVLSGGLPGRPTVSPSGDTVAWVDWEDSQFTCHIWRSGVVEQDDCDYRVYSSDIEYAIERAVLAGSQNEVIQIRNVRNTGIVQSILLPSYFELRGSLSSSVDGQTLYLGVNDKEDVITSGLYAALPWPIESERPSISASSSTLTFLGTEGTIIVENYASATARRGHSIEVFQAVNGFHGSGPPIVRDAVLDLSGNLRLDLTGWPGQQTFHLTAMDDQGQISEPYPVTVTQRLLEADLSVGLTLLSSDGQLPLQVELEVVNSGPSDASNATIELDSHGFCFLAQPDCPRLMAFEGHIEAGTTHTEIIEIGKVRPSGSLGGRLDAMVLDASGRSFTDPDESNNAASLQLHVVDEVFRSSFDD